MTIVAFFFFFLWIVWLREKLLDINWIFIELPKGGSFERSRLIPMTLKLGIIDTALMH